MSYNQYGPPRGPPPGQYDNYGPPRGAPPGKYDNYGPPRGAPPPQQQGGYNRAPAQPGSAPPQQAQSYNGMQYAYSNNTGKRKALLIGINYFGQKSQLGGCINDVRAMRSYLRNNGYKDDDMVILTDDQQNPQGMPTRANIIRAMQWLVADARPNDSLFFHFSGHGSTVRDTNGDEDDGYDETICPVDYARAGMIIDDDLFLILVRPLPQGCRLTAFFDSCHSGTVLDIPFLYSTKGLLKEPNVYKDMGSGLMNAAVSWTRHDSIGAVMGLGRSISKAMGTKNVTSKQRQVNFSPADVISFSGCRDDQTSADASQGGTRAGAMSYSFLQVMSQNPNQTYISLLQNVRNVMRGKFAQKPQLSASHPIDMNLKFII